MESNQSNVVDDFKKIAGQFCALVDSADQTDRTSFLVQLYLILPELIKGGANLPAVNYEDDPDDRGFVVGFGMRQTESDQLYQSLKKKFEPNEIYWVVSECWKSSETFKESLADDIADIYRDLKKGLSQQDTRDMKFELRLLFYSHWGDHAIRALKAIHDLVAEREMD